MSFFKRDKSVSISQLDKSTIEISASLKDQFHEIYTTLIINCDTMEISSATAQMITVPWDLCREVIPKMEELSGLRIQKGLKHKVEEIVGGPHGCVHFVELVMESVVNIMQVVEFYLDFGHLPFEEKMKKIQAINKGICHTYSNPDRNPQMQEIEARNYKPKF